MDKSVLRAFDPLAGKENTSLLATPTSKTVTNKNTLTLSAFFNRYAHPRPRLPPTKLHDGILVDVDDAHNKSHALRSSTMMFADGVRRESFPGKHASVPDLSFNIDEHGFIENKIHHDSSNSSQLDDTEPVTAPLAPRPVSEPDLSLAYTIRMIPAPISPTRAAAKDFPFASPPRASSAVDSSPLTAFKACTIPEWGVAATGSISPTRIPSPTRAISPVRRPVQAQTLPASKPKFGYGFEFAPSDELGPTSTRTRVNAPRNLVPAEQTIIEPDSIMDLQLPNLDDENSSGFLWSSGGVRTPEPVGTLSRKVSVSSKVREPPVFKCATLEHGSGESKPDTSVRSSSRASTMPDDEPTLNISALGLSAFGQTLLMDTSLEQLRSQIGALEDNTFGGTSFAFGGQTPGDIFSAKTPKVSRSTSNPLPDTNAQTTTKESDTVARRVVSDAVVNELRSGRALQRVDALDEGAANSSSKHTNSTSISTSTEVEGTRASRPLSRLSLAGADRPTSVASIRPPSRTFASRPQSVASVRPESVASIRPQSVASVRPQSVISIRPESVTSIRPESAASTHPDHPLDHPSSSMAGRRVSVSLQHLARGMEEDVRKEMQAFMLDDMEEYMRSDDDPSPRAPLVKAASTRLRPRTSTLPPAAPMSKVSKPPARSGIIAPKSGIAKPASKPPVSTTRIKPPNSALTRPSTLISKPAAAKSAISAPKASIPRPTTSTTGSVRGRSAIVPPSSIRGPRPPVAPSAAAADKPKALRPRSSLTGMSTKTEAEPRHMRTASSSTVSSRAATSKTGTGLLSRTASLQMTPGSVASLRRR